MTNAEAAKILLHEKMACDYELNEAIDMAIAALREQKKREGQFRVLSEEEWMETYCTPQQFAGYLKRKSDNSCNK